MTSYVNPFTGATVNPSQIGYAEYTLSANLTLEWPINGNDQSPAASITDVFPTGSGFSIALPPASQVSTGESIVFRNIGAYSFEVTDSSGNLVTSVASGIAQYVFLTDNTTVNGVWATVTFGAGVSSANAAALAGQGLLALNTQLNAAIPSTFLSSNYASSASDRAMFFVWTGGAGSITLPSSSTLATGWFIIVRNSGTGVVTLVPQGTDTLDSGTGSQLQPGESFVVVCTEVGASFDSYGYGQSNTFFFTQLAVTTTGGTTTLSAVQAANTIQTYSGALTSNAVIVVPETVQLYSVNNQTTGAFSLTFKTNAAGGSVVAVPQGTAVILISDGTNVYSATSGSGGGGGSIGTLPNGTQTSPSLNFVGDATTGLYLIGTGQLGIVSGGTILMSLTSAGVQIPVGVASGTF